MCNIKHHNLGTILSYDVFRRGGDKICDAFMIYKPVIGGAKHTVDLRLHYVDTDGNEYFYSIDRQDITATSLDIVAKCDRLFGQLIHEDAFWNYVNEFMGEVKPGDQ